MGVWRLLSGLWGRSRLWSIRRTGSNGTWEQWLAGQTRATVRSGFFNSHVTSLVISSHLQHGYLNSLRLSHSSSSITHHHLHNARRLHIRMHSSSACLSMFPQNNTMPPACLVNLYGGGK
jgi:hypothetical protein